MRDMSADDLAQLYRDVVTDLLNHHCPTVTVRCRAKPSTPWFDSECRDTRRKTRAAERRYWRTRADDDKLAWAAELRTLHSLYRHNHKTDNFWRTEIAASNGNTKKLRKTLQGKLGETCSDETSAHIADDFPGFFETKSTRFKRPLPLCRCTMSQVIFRQLDCCHHRRSE